MVQAPAAIYDKLMRRSGIDGLPQSKALQYIGVLVDLSGDLSRTEGTTRALEWADTLQMRTKSEKALATLNYFRANAWANRTHLNRTTPESVWSWHQPEIGQQVLYLRKAINSPAFEALSRIVRCQALTNLGNQLNTIGRFVEALEYWTRALTINKDFWMARGNRGWGLLEYARAVHDPGHRNTLALSAYRDLAGALSSAAGHRNLGDAKALAGFAKRKAEIAAHLNVAKLEEILKLDSYSLGRTPKEQRYRRWCLQQRLFLNPLNDIGPHTIAARDILTLPDFTTSLDEPPTVVGIFNQMKQEFVSARWLYYEGIHAHRVHYSDRGVLLYNTLDYPSYGLAVEQVKTAARMAWSLFDKTAFFLNYYLKLGIEPKAVSFRSIWRVDGKKNRPIREQFEKSENWPFRGLYWLSRDVLDQQFQESTEPDARELSDIRNHLEHKYLKVHEMLVRRPLPASFMDDDLAYSIRRSDLVAKALRLLKLSRAALMYLSLGMHREEQRRAEGRDPAKVAPMPLAPWDDDWKV